MKDRLIIQSIGPGDDWYIPWMKLSQPIHEMYAAACDADYLLFKGTKDPKIHPAWNRIPMFVDALQSGYDKVLWLDADTLVVNQTVDIFTETDDTTSWQMVRAKDTHVEMPWGEDGWDVYNDGVWIVNNTPEALAALKWVWAQRHAPPLAHHHPSLWEMNWVVSYIFDHRDIVKEIPFRFNWMNFAYATPEHEAVICAWHGMPHQLRFERFLAKYEEVYGVAVLPA